MMLDLTDDEEKIINFINSVGQTHGGDSAECYELVLHEVQTATWTPDSTKVLVMIGDDIPHDKNERQNYLHLNWREELQTLVDNLGIHIDAVQALGRSYATSFYKELALKSGGHYIEIDQFRYFHELILAICFKQFGDEQLDEYEKEVTKNGNRNRGIYKIFDSLRTGKKVKARYAEPGLEAVPPYRFQVLDVDEKQSLPDFVKANGLLFKKGRGFYQLVKRELVQETKEVILMNNETGDMYTGEKARNMIGLPFGQRGKVKPVDIMGHTVFIRSDANNRMLDAETKFLYEVDLDR
jgi:hypothetical protein